MRLDLFPASGLSSRTGYGRNTLGMLHGLAVNGVDVRLVGEDGSAGDAVTLVVGRPTDGTDILGRKWLYTMSESDRVSTAWVDVINAYYEQVFVPCPGLVEVYRASGVSVPVHDGGHTLDTGIGAGGRAPRDNGQFVFLTYSLGDLRKGAELAILAFKRLFGGERHVRLVVKGPQETSWLDGCADDQITVVRGPVTEREWGDLLDEAHAFLFPSRGEGFGMPPREATLAGVPALATAWLGMADVAEWGVPIPARALTPCYFGAYEANARDAHWAEPDVDALQARMLEVVGDYPAAVDTARAGAEYLRARHAPGAWGERFRGFLEAFA